MLINLTRLESRKWKTMQDFLEFGEPVFAFRTTLSELEQTQLMSSEAEACVADSSDF